MSILRNLFFAFALLALPGCTPGITATGTPVSAVLVTTSTSAPPQQPASTPQPGPTSTPLPPPTATPFVPFKAAARVDYVNVRANPGLLFDVKTNVPRGTQFTVLGKAPGDEWINILTPDNISGWVYAQLLKSDQQLASAPLIHPEKVQLISGRVVDSKGNLINGITFAISQGSIRNGVMTDSNGVFYVYLPPASSGEWTVSYTGIDCTSNLMDAKCNCKAEVCGSANPPNISIQVPVSKPLDFLWK